MAAHGPIGTPSVNNLRFSTLKIFVFCLLSVIPCSLLPTAASAQAVPYARTFAKGKDDVEATLKEMQAYAGQKLPIVDGFVAMGEQPLDHYERAFYQYSIDVIPNGTSSTIVRLSAKITAWYADKDPAKSGYQALPSNGRLELDLLDRLGEKFGSKPLVLPRNGPLLPKAKIDAAGNPLPDTVAPATRISGVPGTSGNSSDPEASATVALKLKRETEEKRMLELKGQLDGLKEMQHNQGHPRNLVIVKKNGTPVLARPVDGSKVLFTAAADDEFVFIETEGEWFHVEISGASRGWVRRSLAEAMDPRWNGDGAIAKSEKPANEDGATFKVEREESGPFPGSWAGLKGQTVKVYWVQPSASPTADTTASEKRQYSKELFQKAWKEANLVQNKLAGVVVMFDTPDGGEVATTLAPLKQWMEGRLSETLFWRQCSVDPPELFDATAKH
jgi:hypothetical protein